MSGLPAKIVCQVSGVAWLPTGWLMKGLHGGIRVGFGGGKGRGGSEGWSGPPSLLLQLQSVSDQLLIHSSFTKTTNRGHTRAEAGQNAGRKSSLLSSPIGIISSLLLQKQNTSLSCFFSFLFLSLVDFIHFLSIISRMSLVHRPPPLTCFSGTNQQLSQPNWEQVHRLQNKPLFSDCSHSSGCWFKGRQRLPQHRPQAVLTERSWTHMSPTTTTTTTECTVHQMDTNWKK